MEIYLNLGPGDLNITGLFQNITYWKLNLILGIFVAQVAAIWN